MKQGKLAWEHNSKKAPMEVISSAGGFTDNAQIKEHSCNIMTKAIYQEQNKLEWVRKQTEQMENDMAWQTKCSMLYHMLSVLWCIC